MESANQLKDYTTAQSTAPIVFPPIHGSEHPTEAVDAAMGRVPNGMVVFTHPCAQRAVCNIKSTLHVVCHMTITYELSTRRLSG